MLTFGFEAKILLILQWFFQSKAYTALR